MVQVSVSVNDAAKSNYLAPRIGAYREINQYFIFVEDEVLLKVSTLPEAIFFMFTSYYVFHLEYPPTSKYILWFLQDYIFSYPDSSGRSASYLAVTSDIKRNLTWNNARFLSTL